MAEIQADKDQLRAEFAMSTRRLEISVEQIKTKTTSQLAELGKKADAINRLKIELGEKTATIFALEARDKALRDQLRATEDEIAAKTSAHARCPAHAGRQGSRPRQDHGRSRRALDASPTRRRSRSSRSRPRSRRSRSGSPTAGHEVKAVGRPPRRRAQRAQAATQELDEERGKVENLGRRVGELEQQLAAQTTEAEILGRRAHDLENRLGEQSRLLTEREFEFNQLRGEVETARKTEGDLRSAIAELDGARKFRARSASRRKRRNCRPSSSAPATSATACRTNSAA